MTLPETTIKTAKYSNVKRAKVSATAFSHSGQLIVSAHNRRVYGQKGKFTQHAEEVLLHKLDRMKAFNRFRSITILVIRVNTTGLTMAKPCKKCSKLLQQYPVKILYSGWDQQIHTF
ncbi:MAG: hypothetical protein V3W20_13495 [Candidatus Neomarinimicrobiota bacterium]